VLSAPSLPSLRASCLHFKCMASACGEAKRPSQFRQAYKPATATGCCCCSVPIFHAPYSVPWFFIFFSRRGQPSAYFLILSTGGRAREAEPRFLVPVSYFGDAGVTDKARIEQNNLMTIELFQHDPVTIVVVFNGVVLKRGDKEVTATSADNNMLQPSLAHESTEEQANVIAVSQNLSPPCNSHQKQTSRSFFRSLESFKAR
jgi:hypothetical protein